MEKVLKGNEFEMLEDQLDEDGRIHFQLNGSGVIHIERKLPFMLVYRPSEENVKDVVFENIVKNEASYIICVEEQYQEYRHLVKKIVKKLSDEFGAFLLFEIWPDTNAAVSELNTAGFELLGPADFLPKAVTSVKDYIAGMDLAGLIPLVSLRNSEERCPENFQPLLDKKSLKQLECLLLGLKMEPFYMDPETGSIYPLLSRRLYSEFSKMVKKLVYDFVKVQTSHKFSGFQSLAKRELKNDVWKIDKELVDIDNQIHFLMLVSPVNTKKAWKEFKESGYRKQPVFHYRMMPSDPELLKRTLYNIRIEDIDDPTLGFLFREKRSEVDKMLTMLNERESKDFFYGSLQLFGTVNNKLLTVAREILEIFPAGEPTNKKEQEYLNTEEFAQLAKQELKTLQTQCEDICPNVEIKDTIDNMMVNKGVLNIPSKTKVAKDRANALIQHEIGTHVVTYYNGKSQPLQLLSSGIPGYEELQEGIAVLAEYLSGGLGKGRMQVLAARVIAVDSLVNNNDFVKTFELLKDGFHFPPRKAFFITTRVYRGGGLTKDAIYLRGLLQLINYLKEDNPLEPLLIGKIKQSYLPVINELISRRILKPLKIKPTYLSNRESLQKLSKIKEIESVTDLVNTEL